MGNLHSSSRFLGRETEDSEDDSSKIFSFHSIIYKAIKVLLRESGRFIINILWWPRKSTADDHPILPIQNPPAAAAAAVQIYNIRNINDDNPSLLVPEYSCPTHLNTNNEHSDIVDVIFSQQWPTPEENYSGNIKKTTGQEEEEVMIRYSSTLLASAADLLDTNDVVDNELQCHDIDVSGINIKQTKDLKDSLDQKNDPLLEEGKEEEKVMIESSIINNNNNNNNVVGRGEGMIIRWIKHYNSLHKILLVGEGDFSFSASLALAFGPSAVSNMISTSLDSKAFLKKNYRNAESNIVELRSRGCKVIHGIDATVMGHHELLGSIKFDRIIYNFPFAGFFRNLSHESQLRRHRRLVSLFLNNAKEMLSEKGEIHISHKTNRSHAEWNVESMASSRGLMLVEAIDFNLDEYPGYNTKYGFGGDKNFNCYPSKTYKFGLKTVRYKPRSTSL